MAEETRNFADLGNQGENSKSKKDFPPIAPAPAPNSEEIQRINEDERRELRNDMKLGALAGGVVGSMPGVGIGVADLLDGMRKHPEDDRGASGAPVLPLHLPTDEHRDPISGEPGAHPVGVGVGAATGGAAAGVVSGMAFGSIGGPVGTAIGAAVGATVGAFAGGWAGKGMAESIHPTVLDAEKYEVPEEENDDFKTAHSFGWNSRLEYQDETWDAAEEHLRAEWEADSEFHKHRSWSEVRHCVKESWDQADSTRHI